MYVVHLCLHLLAWIFNLVAMSLLFTLNRLHHKWTYVCSTTCISVSFVLTTGQLIKCLYIGRKHRFKQSFLLALVVVLTNLTGVICIVSYLVLDHPHLTVEVDNIGDFLTTISVIIIIFGSLLCGILVLWSYMIQNDGVKQEQEKEEASKDSFTQSKKQQPSSVVSQGISQSAISLEEKDRLLGASASPPPKKKSKEKANSGTAKPEKSKDKDRDKSREATKSEKKLSKTKSLRKPVTEGSFTALPPNMKEAEMDDGYEELGPLPAAMAKNSQKKKGKKKKIEGDYDDIGPKPKKINQFFARFATQTHTSEHDDESGRQRKAKTPVKSKNEKLDKPDGVDPEGDLDKTQAL